MSEHKLTLKWLKEQNACESALEWLARMVTHGHEQSPTIGLHGPHGYKHGVEEFARDVYYPLRDVIAAERAAGKSEYIAWTRERLPDEVAEVERELDGVGTFATPTSGATRASSRSGGTSRSSRARKLASGAPGGIVVRPYSIPACAP